MFQKASRAELQERTALLTSWGKRHCWELVVDLLRKIAVVGPSPDRVVYGAAIDACEKATQWKWTLLILEDLRDCRVAFENRAFASAASSCGKARLWRAALDLMSTMWYVRLGCDERNFSVAISSCARAVLWMQSLQLLEDMHHFGLLPGLVSITAAISSCEKSGQWRHALALFTSVRDPDVVCVSSIISACEKGTQWSKALAFLHGAALYSVQPNTISFSAAVSACGKAGQWRRALLLVEEISRLQLEIDSTYCVSVVSACERGAQWMLALQLLKRFAGNRMEPGLKGYSAGISACEKGSLWQEALLFLVAMQRNHISPTCFTYNAALSGFAHSSQWQCAFRLLCEVGAIDIVGCMAALYAFEHCQQLSMMYLLVIRLVRNLRIMKMRINISSGSQRFAGERLLENNLLHIFSLPGAVHDHKIWKSLCEPLVKELLAIPKLKVSAEVRICSLQVDVLDLGSRFSKDALNRLSMKTRSLVREDQVKAFSPTLAYLMDTISTPGRPLAKILFAIVDCNLMSERSPDRKWRMTWDARLRG